MENLCFIRNIDELGRVVLPVEIRKYLNIKEGNTLQISLKDNGVFIQKKQ